MASIHLIYVHMPYFLQLFICLWIVSLILLLVRVIDMQVFVWHVEFDSLVHITRYGIVRSYCSAIFRFLSSLPIDSDIAWTNLCSKQQLFTPIPHSLLTYFAFFVVTLWWVRITKQFGLASTRSQDKWIKETLFEMKKWKNLATMELWKYNLR